MTLYSYRCPTCGEVELRHPMSEVDQSHACPTCGEALRRKLQPIHHRWPANHRPGFEQSGQRMLLDPEYQARKKDEFAAKKEAHRNRTAAEQKVREQQSLKEARDDNRG